jgi:hypothetical protein
MKKFLAVLMASVVTLSVAFAQDTGGDKQKVSKSKSVTTTEKNNIKAGAGKSVATKGPKAQPFPTRKPAEKTELNPQPLPPGARTTASKADKVELNPQPLPPGKKVKSTSPAEKVALNPQPLPPGAKVADKPVHSSSTKLQKQRKITTDSGKKASTGIEKGSTKQE